MKILSILQMTEEQKRHFVKAVGEEGNTFVFVSKNEVTRELTAEQDIIIGNVPAEYLRNAPRLKLLQLNSAGADPYIKPGLLREDTYLCNATGAYGKAVSEHCFATALMLMKKLHLYRDNQNARLWKIEGRVTSFTDATVLITGAGDIGTCCAKLCKAFGAKTIGMRRRSAAPAEGFDEIILADAFYDALPKADIIINFLPGTPQTAGLFDKRAFKHMKPTAIFVNGGRGSSVVTDDLTEALRSGEIAAAGLDVFESEPLDPGHPLWSLPNVMITPHVAGGFHLDGTLQTIIAIAERNAAAVVRGEIPQNIVDMSTGYKK